MSDKLVIPQDVEDFAQRMDSGRLFEAARRIRGLGERIARAEAEVAGLRGQVEKLSAPVNSVPKREECWAVPSDDNAMV